MTFLQLKLKRLNQHKQYQRDGMVGGLMRRHDSADYIQQAPEQLLEQEKKKRETLKDTKIDLHPAILSESRTQIWPVNIILDGQDGSQLEVLNCLFSSLYSTWYQVCRFTCSRGVPMSCSPRSMYIICHSTRSW